VIPDDAPDYTKYTLRDLHDVARRIDKVRYADRYASVLEQIRLREVEVGRQPEKPARLLRDWLFEGESSKRTSANIMAWWEKRRLFWCEFVSFLLFSSGFTILSFILVVDAKSRPKIMSEWLLTTLITLVGAFLYWVFVMFVTNIAYSLMCLADLILGVPLRFLGWRLSIGLFAITLAITIVLAVAPIVSMLILVAQR
jgi:hypothetical protein